MLKRLLHHIRFLLGGLLGINVLLRELKETQRHISYLREAVGRIEARQLNSIPSRTLIDREFKVYSQCGEDGIIQWLISQVQIERKIFVEFGVENYVESNTRFLLTNNHWSGLVIDGNQANTDYIKKDAIYWQHNLKVCCAFITKENINELLEQNGISGEIGLLSIDIDGNDYWVWDAITVVRSAIVVIEYNARFGTEKSVSVPYKPNFERHREHPSGIYFGASLRALVELGRQKNYAFVGCNSNGSNAFFIRRDKMPASLNELSLEEGFEDRKFREIWCGIKEHRVVFHDDEAAILSSLPLVEVPLNQPLNSEPKQR
jgi:hypothetical protein